MFSVVFFSTAAGNMPVFDWLRTLDRNDRAVIGEDLRTVQIGYPIEMPICRPLGNGLLEVRSSLPSRREGRLVFFQWERTLVIVNGFIKKTQATPPIEIALAARRRADCLKYR